MSEEKVLHKDVYESQVTRLTAGKTSGDHPDNPDAVILHSDADGAERFVYESNCGVRDGCRLMVPFEARAGIEREIRLGDVVRVTVEVIDLASYEKTKRS